MPSYSPKPEPPPSVREALTAHDALSQQLLFSRGIVTKDVADAFLARAYDSGLHDPFLMNDMDVAVARIIAAMDAGERIGIFSDYDCDGIPGGVLMYDVLTAIGYTNFENYIPHRHEEGYGLSKHAVDVLSKNGVTLIVTVDCGITNVEEVAYANSLGVDMIITDHHEPLPELPPAVAVLNPKRADSTYPFNGLCGSGVAFKLASALISTLVSRGSLVWSAGKEKWFLDVVGLATIADMVPLVDENRLFAHYGLTVIRKGRRLGLQHLFREMKMKAQHVTEDDIGFMIGPRINAASRMGSPDAAFRLLATTDEAEAGECARHLEHINNERKGVVAGMVKSVKQKLALRSVIDPVLVVGDASWRPSLVGLTANTLAEEYQRPVFVWGRDGRDILKGSCRSGGSASVVELMRGAHDVFLEYGGHHASGGFAVKEECIHSFPVRLNEAYVRMTESAVHEARAVTYAVDAELALDAVTPSLVRTLATFAPFGMGNEKPLFLFKNVSPSRVDIFGKQKAHTKLLFRTQRGDLEAIGFFKKPDEYSVMVSPDAAVDMLAHVEQSSFGGKTEIRLRIVDVVSPR